MAPKFVFSCKIVRDIAANLTVIYFNDAHIGGTKVMDQLGIRVEFQAYCEV